MLLASLWHHYISYYYLEIFKVNIIFTATSFILLCLLSMFHIRFMKVVNPYIVVAVQPCMKWIWIKKSLLKTHLFLNMPDSDYLITVLLSNHGIWISRGSNHKKHWWILYNNNKCRHIHHSLLYYKLGFKKMQKRSRKVQSYKSYISYKVIYKFFRSWVNFWSFYDGFLSHEIKSLG